jgi:hypothetical protein
LLILQHTHAAWENANFSHAAKKMCIVKRRAAATFFVKTKGFDYKGKEE